MGRNTCTYLIEQFKMSGYYSHNISHGGKKTTSAEKHILAFLWFAGNKAVIREVALLFDVSLSTIFEICTRVMNFLCNIAPEVIKFPNSDDELLASSRDFENISGFPNVIGCVDGTYIKIRTPSGKIKSTYVNRHHETALTLQGICDSKKRFIDVFTGVSSKTHDARVYSLSFISQSIPNICGNTYHILGDSAYPLSPYLMTPFRDYGNLTAAQKKFNRKFSATRVLIENTFGVLKGRFRQLMCLDFYTVVKSSKFIMSCCVLHNICINGDDLWEHDIPEADNAAEHQIVHPRRDLLRRGEAKRQQICNILSQDL